MHTHQSNRFSPSPMGMEALPWPNGYGFTGEDFWRQHTLSQSERARLDELLGLALLDSRICEQLVVHRDPALLASFGLSTDTCRWLSTIEATSLKELAQTVLASQRRAWQA